MTIRFDKANRNIHVTLRASGGLLNKTGNARTLRVILRHLSAAVDYMCHKVHIQQMCDRCDHILHSSQYLKVFKLVFNLDVWGPAGVHEIQYSPFLASEKASRIYIIINPDFKN